MKRIVTIFPLLIGAALIVLAALPERYRSAYEIDQFASLPALKGGRLKPMDSIARNSLVVLRGRQSVTSKSGKRLSAIEWLMDVTMKPNWRTPIRSSGLPTRSC